MAEVESTAGSWEHSSDRYKTSKDAHRYWMGAIELAAKEEKDWTDNAHNANEVYRSASKPRKAFNILFANTETLVPALYNSTPQPDIRPRGRLKNSDDIGRQTASTLEAVCHMQLDLQDIDDTMTRTVTDSQLQGRGVARVRYNPYISQDEETGEQILLEEVTWEHIPWSRFRRGPARTWDRVPWIAFQLSLTRDELLELNPEAGGDIALDEIEGDDKTQPGKEEKTVFARAKVWEIWDKETRQVWYICEGYKDAPLSVKDDPYNFPDFWPIPRPLISIQDPDTLIPICPYEQYRQQAEELNRVSARIIKLTEVLKYRGIRAGEIKEFEKIAHLEDGEFVASENAMALLEAQSGGLDKSIWAMPIEMIVNVVRELILIRENIKQTIYEITGIADILRGSTDPRETLGAQQLKAQWGSLRVQRLQKDVQRFCRDMFRLMTHIIANDFQPQTIMQMSGDRIGKEHIALMRSDTMMAFRIDIETDSTVQGDVAAQQQAMNGFLEATGRFLQTVGPAVQSGIMPPKAAIDIYQAFVTPFKVGRQVEDTLSELAEMADSLPMGGQSPEQIQAREIQARQAEAEIAKSESEAQSKAIDAQNKGREMKMRAQESRARSEYDYAKLDQDERFRQMELDLQSREADQKDRELNIRETEVALMAAEKEDNASQRTREFDATMRKDGALVDDDGNVHNINEDVAQALENMSQAILQLTEAQNARKVATKDPETGAWQVEVERTIN